MGLLACLPLEEPGSDPPTLPCSPALPMKSACVNWPGPPYWSMPAPADDDEKSKGQVGQVSASQISRSTSGSGYG